MSVLAETKQFFQSVKFALWGCTLILFYTIPHYRYQEIVAVIQLGLGNECVDK